MNLRSSVIIKSEKFKRARELVIFLHGYGANGENFRGGIRHIARKFEDTVFVAPDAPFDCVEYQGKKWFSLSDDLSESEIRAGLELAAPLLLGYISDLREEYSCESVSLVGFSQGAMLGFEMLYHTHLSKLIACAGIFISHKNEELASHEAQVLIVHSDDDTVVPYENATSALRKLNDSGVDARMLTCHGIGHSMSLDLWDSCAEFMLIK